MATAVDSLADYADRISRMKGATLDREREKLAAAVDLPQPALRKLQLLRGEVERRLDRRARLRLSTQHTRAEARRDDAHMKIGENRTYDGVFLENKRRHKFRARIHNLYATHGQLLAYCSVAQHQVANNLGAIQTNAERASCFLIVPGTPDARIAQFTDLMLGTPIALAEGDKILRIVNTDRYLWSRMGLDGTDRDGLIARNTKMAELFAHWKASGYKAFPEWFKAPSSTPSPLARPAATQLVRATQMPPEITT